MIISALAAQAHLPTIPYVFTTCNEAWYRQIAVHDAMYMHGLKVAECSSAVQMPQVQYRLHKSGYNTDILHNIRGQATTFVRKPLVWS